MKKFWETLFNSESDDGTWEVTFDHENKTAKLEFWDYDDENNLKQVSELYLTIDQFKSLLDFSKRLNSIKWENMSV